MLGMTIISPAVMIGIVVTFCLVFAAVVSLVHDNWKPRDPHHRH
ncbi:MAG TPA: hypothetical protein P5123_11880 [Spirochaetota bacterium]|nr:hypothetical protein [Spirochaetota bacterium]